MSVANPGPALGPASSAQMESVLRETEALIAALSRARTARLMLVGALLVFVVVVSVMFYNLGRQLQSAENLEQIRQAAERRLEQNTEGYLREMQLLVDHASPVVTQAFYSRAKQDLPGYLQALDQERGKFADNLQARLGQEVESRYSDSLSRKIEILESEIPSTRDPMLRERIMANLDRAVDRLVEKYYVQELKTQILALYDGWDQFPPVDVPASGEPKLDDQFIGSALELLTYTLTHPEAGNPLSSPTPTVAADAPTTPSPTQPAADPATDAPAAPADPASRPAVSPDPGTRPAKPAEPASRPATP